MARLGGDEFTVLLGDLVDSGDIERVAQEDIVSQFDRTLSLRKRSCLRFRHSWHGRSLWRTPSEIETLIKNADQAMYSAKNVTAIATSPPLWAVQTRMRMI